MILLIALHGETVGGLLTVDRCCKKLSTLSRSRMVKISSTWPFQIFGLQGAYSITNGRCSSNCLHVEINNILAETGLLAAAHIVVLSIYKYCYPFAYCEGEKGTPTRFSSQYEYPPSTSPQAL